MPTHFIRRATAAVLCASALFAATAARAQSEASIGLSMLPVASVVGTASVLDWLARLPAAGDAQRVEVAAP